ncbi:MAG: HAMP domain-containing sensor histidine kinase [Candidatus Kapaibacterium sp.]
MNHFYRKLWLKIALPTALTTFVCVEVVVRFLLHQSLDLTRIEVQKNLANIVSQASLFLPASDHQTALSKGDTLTAHQAFERLRIQMNMMRERINFREHWYTLLPNRGDTTWFGVMSHPTSFSGDIHIFRDTSVRNAFETALHRKKTTTTNIYTDDHGKWISAFAPIIDRGGTSVAVLEIDLTYSDYLEREQALYTQANWARILGLVISGLLGIGVGYVIAKPIRAVSSAVSAITDTNFEGKVRVPLLLQWLPDETTTLIESFNRMSSKLSDTLSALRKANVRLSTLDNAKSVFLKFVAHELRTPLNGLNSLSFIPKLQDLEPDSAEILEGGIQSAERLKTFALAAEEYIQALNHTPTESEALNFYEILDYAVSDCRYKAEPAGITCAYHPSDNVVHITIAPDIIDKIIQPILDNAVKFSTSGGTVSVRVRQLPEKLECIIEDSGVGFIPDYCAQIFEPFFVADIQQHGRGSGVSIATAKVLAEHYNGTIQAVSPGVGMGSTFIITLPIQV